MDSHRITPLTEGGLLAALTVVIALAAVYLPLVGPFIALLWPPPLAVLVLRHGFRQGFLAMLVAGAALSMLMDPVIALRLVLGFGPLGLVLGFLLSAVLIALLRDKLPQAGGDQEKG